MLSLPDLRGSLTVSAPTGATLPDWSPASPPTYYFNGKTLTYSNQVFHLFRASTFVQTLPFGSTYNGSYGIYTVVINDTKLPVTITQGKTTAVTAGRIEIGPWTGTFGIDPLDQTTASTYTYTFNTTGVPIGIGLMVAPGNYSVQTTYHSYPNILPTNSSPSCPLYLGRIFLHKNTSPSVNSRTSDTAPSLRPMVASNRLNPQPSCFHAPSQTESKACNPAAQAARCSGVATG